MSLRLMGAALAAALLLSVPAAAEDAAGGPAWKAPRTAWGDPDLRGNWPIDYLGQTPRIRPPQYGTRAELTDEEYDAALASAEDQLQRYDQEEEAGKIAMGHWTERGKPLRQTSLMVEPANGRMPAMTEEGARRSKEMRSSWSETVFNKLDDFNTFDRCITRGMPSSMLPGAYNMGIEVWQAPGIVAIRLEMIHETRIVRLDGAPPPPGVRNWLGYSRGHWEGDTLVIETTNYEPGNALGTVDGAALPVPNSDRMVTTERLTPTGPDAIRYELTVTDPVVLTAPMKFDFPWRRNTAYEEYEYACHEGNVQVRGYIEGTSDRPWIVAKREAEVKARDGGGQ